MASFRDLHLDWSMLCQECTDCWTSEDLQLAAELGKTLLERNKELEGSLRQKQTVIDDQKQEIEYLTKQTAALREVSDSRLRIYEQLEISIQDLERQNHRLVLENSSGKKHIKSLSSTIESLELKCEELQTTIDELRLQVDVFKRKSLKSQEQAQNFSSTPITLRHVRRNDFGNVASPEEEIAHISNDEIDCKTLSPVTKKTEPSPLPQQQQQQQQQQDKNEEDDDHMEQISQLLAQLREGKTQFSRDQRKIAELEEQLATVIQQNQALENQVIQLHHQHDDERSMYDELNTLEEVRKGQMCSRCLRNVDKSNSDVPEDDDSSMLEDLMEPPQFRSSYHMDVQETSNLSSASNKTETGHLYKDLVEKYEALLEVHRRPSRKQKRNISLQEELQLSGDFSQTTPSVKDTDEESGHGDSLKPDKRHIKGRHQFPHTPTDFSEAETSSSGFSDETSNKATQTEDRPGSFLCTIADGDDCKLSIYDDTSPLTSRFKNRPDYQKLFKEIFGVLKNTTDTKPEEKENESIPEPAEISTNEIVQQQQQHCDALTYDDDSQSVVSSTMSELSLSQQEPTTIIEDIIQSQNQPIPEVDVPTSTKEERVLRPLVRQPLEYLSVEVRKRSSSRRKNKYAERSDSPVTHIIGSPKINYSSRPSSGRRRGRDPKTQNTQEAESLWNGNTLQFWSTNRNVASPTPSQGSGKAVFEFKPSLASQDLHKLKKLDLSYAQVLRNADNKKLARHQHQGRK